MIMKKKIAALLAAITALPAMAQYDGYEPRGQFADEHNVYYGLRLGLGISTVNSDEKELDGGGAKTGLNIGAVIGFQLSPAAPVYLESGLFYTEKGGKGHIDGAKHEFGMNYLKLPVIVKYKYSIDENFSIQPFAGGYFAYGISGKIKNYAAKETFSTFSDSRFKRFDGGLKFGCGAEYQMIYAEIGYDLGLANLSHSDFDSSHNGCFYINCGVNF